MLNQVQMRLLEKKIPSGRGNSQGELHAMTETEWNGTTPSEGMAGPSSHH